MHRTTFVERCIDNIQVMEVENPSTVIYPSSIEDVHGTTPPSDSAAVGHTMGYAFGIHALTWPVTPDGDRSAVLNGPCADCTWHGR